MDASEYLVEVDAFTGSGVETLRISSCGYATKPTDTPADTFYRGVISDPGYFEQHLFGQGRTQGKSDVAVGSIELINIDGSLDAWVDYGFSGRPIVVKRLANRNAAFSSAVVVFRGTVQQIDSNSAYSVLRLIIFDRRLELDRPIQTTRFAGTTTSGGATAEGNTDLKGQVKPLVFGSARNVTAVPVNTFDLIYQVNDGAVASITVFDGRAPLRFSADYADLTALFNASVLAGQYATCLALGLFRVGSAPEYKITADVMEGATAAARYPGAIVTRMLAQMGIGSGDLDTASFTALDAAAPYEIGLFIQGDATGLDQINAVLASVGGWVVPTADNRFSVGQFSAPGTPAGTLIDRDTADDEIGIATNNDTKENLPVYRIALTYSRNWTIQGDDQLAGCVGLNARAAYHNEWRETVAEDASVLNKHLLSPELPIETLLVNSADADAEAARRLALYKVTRWVVSAEIERSAAEGFSLGQTITLLLNRFVFTAGKPMVIIGRRTDPAKDSIHLWLWG